MFLISLPIRFWNTNRSDISRLCIVFSKTFTGDFFLNFFFGDCLKGFSNTLPTISKLLNSVLCTTNNVGNGGNINDFKEATNSSSKICCRIPNDPYTLYLIKYFGPIAGPSYGDDICGDWEEAARDADVVVVVTEWSDFRAIVADRLAELMRGRIVVDFRNIFDSDAMAAAELIYHPIGRAPVGTTSAAARARGPQRAVSPFDLAEALI